jgi:formyltetrahydrofolate-dependent phosphoribosylglycinamide formyltransferase
MIAVLVSGRGSNLQALLDATRDNAPGRIALVISDREDAGALGIARGAGVSAEWVSLDGGEADLTLALLEKHRIGLVVLAGYLKRVSDRVVAAYHGRIVNVHPALLPAFGGPGMYGRRVHAAVLESGARVSGATVHVVDEQYDHGPVLAQWPVPVRPGDTAESLAARVLAVEHLLLPAVVLACCARLQSGAEPAALAASADAFALSTTLPDFRHALVPA